MGGSSSKHKSVAGGEGNQNVQNAATSQVFNRERGGVHFLEVHMPSVHVANMALMVIVVAILLFALAFWCRHRRQERAARRRDTLGLRSLGWINGGIIPGPGGDPMAYYPSPRLVPPPSSTPPPRRAPRPAACSGGCSREPGRRYEDRQFEELPDDLP